MRGVEFLVLNQLSKSSLSVPSSAPSCARPASGGLGLWLDLMFLGLALMGQFPKELEELKELVEQGTKEGVKMIADMAEAGGRVAIRAIAVPVMVVGYLIDPGSGSSGKNSEVESNSNAHPDQRC